MKFVETRDRSAVINYGRMLMCDPSLDEKAAYRIGRDIMIGLLIPADLWRWMNAR